MSVSLLEPYLVTFGLLLLRCSAAFAVIPIFGGEAIPRRFRAALAAIIAAVLTALVPPDAAVSGLANLLLAAAGELLLGLALGLALRLVLIAAELAGEVAGMQMGFAFSRVADPLSLEPAAVTARLNGIFALLLFLAIDGPHQVVAGLHASVTHQPPGQVLEHVARLSGVVRLLSTVTEVGVRIAAPVVVALLLTNLAVGWLARAAPQLNLFVLAFGITIVIGMTMLAYSVPPSMRLLIEQLRQVPMIFAAVVGS